MNIGLVFGMIVAIMMMVIILVFGYDQLMSVQDLQQEAEHKRMIKAFGDAVDRVYSLGGESSERFTMSLPANVDKICFVPFFNIDTEYIRGNYEDYRVPYTENELRYDLEEVITGMSWEEEGQLTTILINLRKNYMQPLLVFFISGTAEWEDIPHLGPSKKDDEVLCVKPGTQLWLKRTFDSEGAWVDVEEI